MNRNRQFRIEVLKSFGASDKDIKALLNYNDNVFDHSKSAGLTFPLKDEIFIESWQKYAERAKEIGTFNALKEVFIQFNFPVKKGISKTKKYLDAVLSGVLDDDIGRENGLQLKEPEKIELVIRQTLAGKIPIIIVYDREDFVSIIRAVSEENEPAKIPDAFGASMFSGYNNWNRVWALEKEFLQKNPGMSWDDEFDKIIPQKELYQDKFIILSSSYYSGVKPEILGVDPEEWKKLSVIIRREHECTHYFTKRAFGSMRNNIIDEIMADYAGLTAATGKFEADWFLYFLGLENYPEYRKSGRLEIYKGDLIGNAFKILQELIIRAAKNLEEFSKKYNTEISTANTIMALTNLTLEELASEKAIEILEKQIKN